MAVCEIWDVRGRLDHPIDYAENPEKTANPKYTEADLQAMVDVMEYATNKDKTEQRYFVTGVNCDPTTARDEMMIAKAQWNDESEIVCYHGFQSFKHGEVTPEQAHEVGVKLAQKMWGDRFQVIVATHLNTDCLHNHFVVNSVSFTDGENGAAKLVPLRTASITTTTKQTCGFYDSVPMSFAVNMPCPSLNTQAEGKSHTLCIRLRKTVCPRGIMLHGRRWTKLSASHSR